MRIEYIYKISRKELVNDTKTVKLLVIRECVPIVYSL